MNTCTISCQRSKTDKCICACHGEHHGGQLVFIPIPNVRLCAHCPRQIHFELGKDWVHPGGMTYVMEHPACGWIGEQPAGEITIETDVCPGCGAVGELQDNHVAMPGKLL